MVTTYIIVSLLDVAALLPCAVDDWKHLSVSTSILLLSLSIMSAVLVALLVLSPAITLLSVVVGGAVFAVALPVLRKLYAPADRAAILLVLLTAPIPGIVALVLMQFVVSVAAAVDAHALHRQRDYPSKFPALAYYAASLLLSSLVLLALA